MRVRDRPDAELLAVVHHRHRRHQAAPGGEILEARLDLGERNQVAEPLADREDAEPGALVLGEVIPPQGVGIEAGQGEVAVVHEHVLDAGLGQHARQVRLPHALGEPHAARADPDVRLEEGGEALDLAELVVVRQDGEDGLVESARQQLDLAAPGERDEQVEGPGREIAQPLEEAARAVHDEPDLGPRVHALEKRTVGTLRRLDEHVVKVPDRLVVVDPEAERQPVIRHGPLLFLQIAVDDVRRVTELVEEPSELFCQRHRAMAAPGAADRDRQIGLALALVAREQELEKALEVLEELSALRIVEDELSHARVAPVEGSEPRDEVRVRQEAHVEDQVGVERDAVLEAERHEQGGEARPRAGRDVVLDEELLESVDGQPRGVDDPVGDLAQVRHRLALGADALENVAIDRQRVAAAGLVVPPDETLLARLEEEDLDGMAARLELVDRVEQVGKVLPLPDVHAQRHPPDRLARPRDQISEGWNERRGQVVDTEEAHVLEALDRVALPGAAEPGDEDEGQTLVHGPDAGTRRLPHRLRGWSRRWCEGRMPSSSRYFATVRRAIVRPRPLRIPATSWSDRGLVASSFPRRSWIIFFTETEETISPSAQARNPLLVQHDRVVAPELVDEDVRHDVARVVAAEAAAGLGLERHDLFDRLHDPVGRQLQRPRDVRVAAAAQVLEVPLDDLDRHRVDGWVRPQLEQEALRDRSRANADRVEFLDHLGQDALDLLGRRGAPLGDLLELRAKVPVLVEVADDLGANPPGRRVLGDEAELLLEVVGERRDRAHHVLERDVLPLLLRDEGALLRLVEHHGDRVERQLVRLSFGGRRRIDGDRLHRRRRRRLGARRGLARLWRLGAVHRHLFQQRVLEEFLLHDLLELERGELQELDGLLEQRGHDDPLALPEREARFHGHGLALPRA